MKLNLDEEFEKQKKKKKYEAIKKWRKENPEKYKKIQDKAMTKYQLTHREQHRKSSLDYYNRNKEEVNARRREKYKQKKEMEAQKNAMERNYEKN